MSYYATFDALITLSREVDMEAIAEEAKRAFCAKDKVIDNVTDTTFDLWLGDHTDYTDHAAWAFLAEITPHTISGEIVYEGEDNTWWRHRFDKTKGEWMEEEGYIEYEDVGKSVKKLLNQRNEQQKTDPGESER